MGEGVLSSPGWIGRAWFAEEKKIKGNKINKGAPLGGTTNVVGGSIPPVPAREK